MEIYRTEEEQVEQVKRLWRNYGLPIIVGIILALGLSYAWRSWQGHQAAQYETASVAYLQLLSNVAQNKREGIKQQANQLLANYPKTPYASLAAMQLAKQAVLANNLSEAQTRFQWVIEHAADKSLKELAVLQAARVYIAQNQPQQALDLLAKQPGEIFSAYVAEVRGDALLAMQQPAAARQAYAQALKEMPDARNTKPLLQMKYDAIAA